MKDMAALEYLLSVLARLKQQTLHLLPKVLVFLAILCIGWLLAWLIKRLIVRLAGYFTRFFPSRLKTASLVPLPAHGPASRVIAYLAFWGTLLLIIAIAIETTKMPVLSEWASTFMAYIPNIIFAILIIAIGCLCAAMLKDTIITFGLSIGLTQPEQFGRIAQLAIILISLVIGVEQLGVNTFFLTTIISILLGVSLMGLVFSFSLGAKLFITNIIASYYLQKVFKVGHLIRIADVQGRIKKITSIAVIVDAQEGQCVIPAKTFNETAATILDETTL